MKNTAEYRKMLSIVHRHGGYREKAVLSVSHIVEHDETWNDLHKVLNVLEAEPQADGYHAGFSVDLVTGSIVG